MSHKLLWLITYEKPSKTNSLLDKEVFRKSNVWQSQMSRIQAILEEVGFTVGSI